MATEPVIPNLNGSRRPLVDRTAAVLEAKAEELRGMAATARTQDIGNALARLADRYHALARREGVLAAHPS